MKSHEGGEARILSMPECAWMTAGSNGGAMATWSQVYKLNQ